MDVSVRVSSLGVSGVTANLGMYCVSMIVSSSAGENRTFLQRATSVARAFVVNARTMSHDVPKPRENNTRHTSDPFPEGGLDASSTNASHKIVLLLIPLLGAVGMSFDGDDVDDDSDDAISFCTMKPPMLCAIMMGTRVNFNFGHNACKSATHSSTVNLTFFFGFPFSKIS